MAFRELKDLNVKNVKLILLLSVATKKVAGATAAQVIFLFAFEEYTSSASLEIREYVLHAMELSGVKDL